MPDFWYYVVSAGSVVAGKKTNSIFEDYVDCYNYAIQILQYFLPFDVILNHVTSMTSSSFQIAILASIFFLCHAYANWNLTSKTSWKSAGAYMLKLQNVSFRFIALSLLSSVVVLIFSYCCCLYYLNLISYIVLLSLNILKRKKEKISIFSNVN